MELHGPRTFRRDPRTRGFASDVKENRGEKKETGRQVHTGWEGGKGTQGLPYRDYCSLMTNHAQDSSVGNAEGGDLSAFPAGGNGKKPHGTKFYDRQVRQGKAQKNVAPRGRKGRPKDRGALLEGTRS